MIVAGNPHTIGEVRVAYPAMHGSLTGGRVSVDFGGTGRFYFHFVVKKNCLSGSLPVYCMYSLLTSVCFARLCR